MRRLPSILIFAASGLMLIVAPAHARNVVVPRDYPNIQAAVNAAAPGDTVKVRNGIYTEEVVLAKDLTLEGAGVDETCSGQPEKVDMSHSASTL